MKKKAPVEGQLPHCPHKDPTINEWNKRVCCFCGQVEKSVWDWTIPEGHGPSYVGIRVHEQRVVTTFTPSCPKR